MTKLKLEKLEKFLLKEFGYSDVRGGRFRDFGTMVNYSELRHLKTGEERLFYIKKIKGEYYGREYAPIGPRRKS